MPLTECRECADKVSTKAWFCANCGIMFPRQSPTNNLLSRLFALVNTPPRFFATISVCSLLLLAGIWTWNQPRTRGWKPASFTSFNAGRICQTIAVNTYSKNEILPRIAGHDLNPTHNNVTIKKLSERRVVVKVTPQNKFKDTSAETIVEPKVYPGGTTINPISISVPNEPYECKLQFTRNQQWRLLSFSRSKPAS
jgi:hypothetical protein